MMKNILILFVFVLMLSIKTKAQNIPDSVRYRVEQRFYQRLLKIDAVKARQVAVVQSEYKDKLSGFFGRFDLDAKGKAKALAGLDSARNSQLAHLLTSEELAIFKKISSH